MAKELPYFQFEPAEYLTGDISFCSLATQGLFTNLCSYYWQRSCKLTKEQFLRRLNHPKELQELINENVIEVEENDIIIKFLDAQFDKVAKQSKTNSINGSKGGRPKKKKPTETEIKPKLNPIESQTKGIREDKRKEEEIREDEMKEDEVKEIDHDSIYPLDVLVNYYLSNEQVVKAVVRNKENKIKDVEHLKIRVNEFKTHLIESGRATESFKEFASYFRNWTKVSKVVKPKADDNPNNEKMITFTSNVNPSRQQLPESKYYNLVEKMKGGGYVYTIVA